MDNPARQDIQDIIQDGEDLSADAKRRGFRLVVFSAMFAVIGAQVFALNIMTMIAWNLGAEERFIGFLDLLVFGSSFAQLFIVPLAQRTCKKRFVLIMLVAGCVATVPIFFAKSVSDRSVYAGLALLAWCVVSRQICMFLAVPSWMGLLREMIAPQRRGRLLGTLRTMWQATVVLTLFLTGWYLGAKPSWQRLQVVILIGFFAQIFRVIVLLPVGSPPRRQPARRMSWWLMVSTPIRDRTYRPFLFYMVCYGLAMGMSERFRIVYLLRLGFGHNIALIASSLISLGAVITLMFWGKLADRFGNRGVFGLTLAGMAGCTLLWLFVGDTTTGTVLAFLLFAVAGAFNSGHGLVQTRYMFSALRPEFDAAYIAITTLALALSIGIGAFLSGQILGATHDLFGDPRRSIINNYHITFTLAAATFLFAFYFRRKFREPTEPPTREVLTAITRPLRVIVGPILFWPRANGAGDNGRRQRK